MTRALLALAALLGGCATTSEDDPDVVEVVRAEEPDEALDDLERAFAYLRQGQHARARRVLEDVVPLFDDLALEGTPLERAFASDASKPYRGRPHERVLATTLLAALDIERGRCDLAVPALRNAAFLDARAKPDEPSDAVLVHALALRCLEQTRAAASDRARARDDLARALAASKRSEGVDEVAALATAERLELVLDGRGPTVVADGTYGERTRIVAGAPGGDVARIRLGGRGARAAPREDAERGERKLEAWSSTRQATTIGGRPYDEVLAQRAVRKSRTLAEGSTMWTKARETALTSAPRGQVDPKKAIASALFATSSIGLTTIGNATDARADTRHVTSLFERATLVAR